MNLKIETTRMVLRAIQPGDEQHTFPAIDNELTKFWIVWEPAKNIEEEKQRIDKILSEKIQGKIPYLLAFDKVGENFIGCCGIVPYKEFKEYEIDLWVKKRKQGKGFGKEMLNALVAWMENNLELPLVIYSVTEGNQRSLSISKSLNLPIVRTFKAFKEGGKKADTTNRFIACSLTEPIRTGKNIPSVYMVTRNERIDLTRMVRYRHTDHISTI